MNPKGSISSQITFLYFDDLISVIPFFEETLKLELVTKQDAARIYRMAGNAYIGIVDGAAGHWQARAENAVLITLVVDDVEGWYAYLSTKDVKLLSGIQKPEIAPVECFFFEGPGGYHFEIQRFLDPETAQRYR
jgi:glyoxalase/bleomycin resistance protein/dioxygenase superfamily protein